jgi:large subunit ribosomal protein L35
MIFLSVVSAFAASPGNHTTGKGRQHEDDDGGAGTVYAGLARLFRILRNTADRLNPLGPIAAQSGFVAAVENAASSPASADGTGGARAAGEQYSRQQSRPLVSRRYARVLVLSFPGIKVMPKLKTHKGASKRFKKTGTGKVVREHAFARHILTSKSRKRKNKLHTSVVADESDQAKLKRMIPY